MMFEGQTKKSLAEAPSGGPKGPKMIFNWDTLSVVELIKAMDEIKARLPPLAIKDLSIESEVLTQFHALRSVQNEALEDDTVPLNQRVQLANSVTGALKSLGDLQNSLYTSERFKKIEGALIRTLNTLPKEAAEAFLNDYAQIVRKN